jgi:hypothetical protein
MLNFDRLFIYEETVLDNLNNAVSSFSIILKLKGKIKVCPLRWRHLGIHGFAPYVDKNSLYVDMWQII